MSSRVASSLKIRDLLALQAAAEFPEESGFAHARFPLNAGHLPAAIFHLS
jgi:hypothetical protein